MVSLAVAKMQFLPVNGYMCILANIIAHSLFKWSFLQDANSPAKGQ